MNADASTLVTGVSGFAGEYLARSLGMTLPGLIYGTYFTNPIHIDGVTTIAADLHDALEVEKMIGHVRPKTVFHCAAVTDVARCERDPDLARSGIVDSTRNLANAIQRQVPDCRVIALSTDLVFGGDAAPYNEQSRPQPLSVYGKLKLEAESPVLELRRATVLRPAIFFGPKGTHRQSFLSWMIETLRNGRRLRLFEDEIRTPVDIADLCTAMVDIVALPAHGVWHIGGSERLDRCTMGQILCSIFSFDAGLIDRIKLADSTYSAPRPRDVSLDSSRLWQLLRRTPRRFADSLQKLHAAGR